MKYLLISLLFFFLLSTGFSQEKKHTLVLPEGASSPEASLEDYAWIASHWQGEAFGGITEEVWTAPLGGSMMGSFKLVADGKVQFYEIMTITQEGKTLMMKLKHFHANLKGWEEKDDTVDFPLVKANKDHLYFEGLTFEKVSDKEMNVYVVVEEGGNQSEVKFTYKKVLP